MRAIAETEQAPAEVTPWNRRLDVDIDGGLVRLRSRYDPELVRQIKALPGRRYIRARAEWVVPARREALAALAALVDRLGDAARPTQRASRRLERARPGQIEVRAGQFELSFALEPRRLARVRSIPERRFQPERRSWMVPPTRAGAIALLALINEGEFAAEPGLVSRLSRLAAAREPGDPLNEAAECAGRRASPAPHWRHVTRGPIFEANRSRREWVAGIGWCVRVRVDPTPGRRAGDGRRAERRSGGTGVRR